MYLTVSVNRVTDRLLFSKFIALKYSLLIAATTVVVFFVSQAFIAANVSDTEKQTYEVLRTFEDFEIRRYAPAVYYKVAMESESYRKGANTGFRTLADYIFGGNERSERIAMTSPVTTELGENREMKFAAPQGYGLSALPKPNNKSIQFEQTEAKVVAAVRFGGWADDEKIEKYKRQLSEALKREGIAHSEKFSFLGYNPPYDLINRRNEIIVDLDSYTAN